VQADCQLVEFRLGMDVDIIAMYIFYHEHGEQKETQTGTTVIMRMVPDTVP
jgi:hypothetical protein